MQKIALRCREMEFTSEQASQAHQVNLWLKINRCYGYLLPTSSFKPTKIHTSQLQENVALQIKNSVRNGILIHEEYAIDPSLIVDIAIVSEHLVIEVDGPSHFNQLGQELETTLFKRRLLQKLGWTVISFPYTDWDKLKTEDQQKAYLEGYQDLKKLFK